MSYRTEWICGRLFGLVLSLLALPPRDSSFENARRDLVEAMVRNFAYLTALCGARSVTS